MDEKRLFTIQFTKTLLKLKGAIKMTKTELLTNEEIAIAQKITNKIIRAKKETRFNAEFISLQHHDGEIKFGEWGRYSVFSRSKLSANIRTWYNCLLTKKEIYQQVLDFIAECKSCNLQIKY